MIAGRYNFTIEQGSDSLASLTWETGKPLVAVDLTGFTARMKLKDDQGQVLLSLSTTPSPAGDVITLGGATGTIVIAVNRATTTALSFVEAAYDLEMVPGWCRRTAARGCGQPQPGGHDVSAPNQVTIKSDAHC